MHDKGWPDSFVSGDSVSVFSIVEPLSLVFESICNCHVIMCQYCKSPINFLNLCLLSLVAKIKESIRYTSGFQPFSICVPLNRKNSSTPWVRRQLMAFPLTTLNFWRTPSDFSRTTGWEPLLYVYKILIVKTILKMVYLFTIVKTV